MSFDLPLHTAEASALYTDSRAHWLPFKHNSDYTSLEVMHAST